MKFTKAERLCSKKIIDKLFEKGSDKTNSVFCYPFRVVYLQDPAQENALPQILISVSKRTFKHAVDRNLIKRRIKEAYRLNKEKLHQNFETKPPTYIAFLYIAKEKMDFKEIERKLLVTMKNLAKAPTPKQ